MTAETLLKELIAIDSTSSLSNLPVLQCLRSHLPGFDFEEQDLGEGKFNLIARRGGGGALALVGHTDCVPYDKGWQEALAGVTREGKMYGRGAADTKAFIAISVAAALQTSQPVTLVFTADEEIGCLGARKLQPLKVTRAIIGEPTRMTPVIGHKGYCLAEIIVTGVEGHSAYPETGNSAIMAAGRVLQAIEEVQEALRPDSDPRFSPPYTTLNVGLIAGGKAKNIIAGECRLTVEWRPIPSQDVRRALALLEEKCSAVAKASVHALRLDKGIAVDGQASLLQFLQAETGRAPETIPFGTELPYLAAMGIEACVFGPGDIRTAHRTGEFVPLAELHRAADILTAAIQRFS